MGITYVRSNVLHLAAPGNEQVVVDLGLGINEAAKIVGVLLSLDAWCLTPGSTNTADVAYSFDPEDLVPAGDDDEQFAHLRMRADLVGVTVGAARTSQSEFLDFTGMTLVTARNLSLMLAAAVADEANCFCKVYYEKYKPSAQELIQLIAQRR